MKVKENQNFLAISQSRVLLMAREGSAQQTKLQHSAARPANILSRIVGDESECVFRDTIPRAVRVGSEIMMWSWVVA